MSREVMSKCFRCGRFIPEPTTIDAFIDRELDYRANFENSQEDKVLVCNPCFDEMAEEDEEYYETSE